MSSDKYNNRHNYSKLSELNNRTTQNICDIRQFGNMIQCLFHTGTRTWNLEWFNSVTDWGTKEFQQCLWDSISFVWYLYQNQYLVFLKSNGVTWNITCQRQMWSSVWIEPQFWFHRHFFIHLSFFLYISVLFIYLFIYFILLARLYHANMQRLLSKWRAWTK